MLIVPVCFMPSLLPCQAKQLTAASGLRVTKGHMLQVVINLLLGKIFP